MASLNFPAPSGRG